MNSLERLIMHIHLATVYNDRPNMILLYPEDFLEVLSLVEHYKQYVSLANEHKLIILNMEVVKIEA